MLRTLVDQCLSLAEAASDPQRARGRIVSPTRGPAPQASLAHYPRLQAVLEKAEMDGVLPTQGRLLSRR